MTIKIRAMVGLLEADLDLYVGETLGLLRDARFTNYFWDFN